ncbi:hypothetical protein Tco_0670977, partial [Tanacetum coccineum]
MVQPAKTTIVEGVVTVMPITTAEEKAQRRLERNLQQIHPDDNEETDLRCKSHVDYRVKRLLKNTGRKLTVNGNETMAEEANYALMAFLIIQVLTSADYEEIDGGYVAFERNPKGGKVTGKDEFYGRTYILSMDTSEAEEGCIIFYTPRKLKSPLLKDEDGEEVDVICIHRIFTYLKGQPKLGLWYPKDSPFDLVAYTDSDYAGASLDRKSTTGGKAKKSVKLMMEKLFRIELELMLFWSTVKAKTINGEVQLHALVDGKKIIIIESIVRRDLQLEDAEGVDCLSNSTIFEQLTLMGSKTTAWNEFSSTMASAIICLATNQKFNFSKYIFE